MENYEWLYFLAIAEENSLTKAAQKLFISQPALSQYLSKLEKRLGMKLYERQKNSRLVLTSAGVRYKQYCEDALRLWNDARQEMLEQDQRRVVIGVSVPSIQKALSAYFSSQVFHAAPIEIRYERAADLQEKVLSGEIQLALGAYCGKHPQLQYRMVTCRELDLVVSKNHPLAVHSYLHTRNENVRVRLSDVGHIPFVLLQQSAVMRQTEEQYFQQLGFQPRIARETERTEQTWQHIAGGECIGFYQRQFQKDNLPDGVVPVALDPPVFYTSGAFYRKDFTLTPELLQIIELYCASYFGA